MKDIRSLEQTLSDNLPWNIARIKFVADMFQDDPASNMQRAVRVVVDHSRL